MREVTRIITLSITEVKKMEGNDPLNTDLRDFKEFAEATRVVLDVDDVNISNVQYFEREVEDGKE